ncbi:MAG: DNA repair protein [Janthinobacterium lividum]
MTTDSATAVAATAAARVPASGAAKTAVKKREKVPSAQTSAGTLTAGNAGNAGEVTSGNVAVRQAPVRKAAARKVQGREATVREAAAGDLPETLPDDGALDVATLRNPGGREAVLADGGVARRGRVLPDMPDEPEGRVSMAGPSAAAVDAGTVNAIVANSVAVKPDTVQTADVRVADVRVADVRIADLIPTVVRPEYWEQACADLMTRDRILKKLIPQFGPVHLKARGDPFVTLARSIIGQQISVKAAQSVWERVLAACPDIVPAAVVELGYERLAACGLSRRKAEYIIDLGQHFVGGALHVDRWASMDDEDVIEELTRIRGIGRWTAEMFLIFNLMRPDVLPLDDLGLIKAISVNYFSGEPVTRSEAREVAANWEPWRTVATWYMWRSLEPVPVVY